VIADIPQVSPLFHFILNNEWRTTENKALKNET